MKVQNSQMSFLSKDELRYTKAWSHGGTKYKNRRKTKRPLIPGKITHVVFKSSKARGKLSFLSNQIYVKQLLRARARKYFITIHEWVNMGNHLHLKVTFKDIERFQNFLRTFAAILARKLTGATRLQSKGKFWDGLVYTRVLHSSLEALGLKGYFEANRRERAFGTEARESYLEQWNKYIQKLRKVRALSRRQTELILSLE